MSATLVDRWMEWGKLLLWALIASGQAIVTGDFLESVGDGKVRKFNAGVKIATAIESKTSNATVRLRIEVL